jgi:hypothetical protein
MTRRPTTTAAIVVVMAQLLLAQSAMKPTAPGTPGDPQWQGVIHMTDGRTFITDGGLAVDTSAAKPAKLPARVVSGKVLETYLTAKYSDEFGFSDLARASSGKTYTTPKGVPLNATYVDYLRRILSVRAVRFRMSGELDPVLILENGKMVAVLMPVHK